MPTYAYRCTACGNELDVQQSFSDPSLTDCPSCGGALRKLFSPVGVVFKGSGFYRNDARAGTGKSSGVSSGSGGSGGSSTPAAGGGSSSGSDGSSGAGASSSPASSSTASTTSTPSSTPKAATT